MAGIIWSSVAGMSACVTDSGGDIGALYQA